MGYRFALGATMTLDMQKSSSQNHQAIAQKLLDQSTVLKQLFQDQWFYLWDLTPENIFIVDELQHQLVIANGLVRVHFSEESDQVVQFSSDHTDLNVQKIVDFICHDLSFLIRDLKVQHSLFLQTKVQLFRQLIVEQVFEWVDGENRIEHFLYNLSVDQAKSLDEIMMGAEYYDQTYLTEFALNGKEIPLEVELNFKHLSLINSILGQNFLPVNQLIPYYDELCYSGSKFIPKPLYRIIESSFDEQFNFAQVIEHQRDFKLLAEHARQHPHLLAFSQWIKRGYWQYTDIFSKKNFLEAHVVYWDERLPNKFPLFYYKRTVNWLFKQDQLVIDWIANNIENLNARITVTALSFVDTSQIHPQVGLQTLKYFESITIHLFISDISHYADEQGWFDLDSSLKERNFKHPYFLRQNHKHEQHRIKGKIEITDSVLYTEEWLNLLFYASKDDQRIAKQAYARISRVIQAYMLHVQKLIQDIPEPLIAFIHPESQQHPKFAQLLKSYQMSVDDFRAIFKHASTRTHRAVSVFESYVADYLGDFFYDHLPLPKSVTWSGLYQQALRWHQQAHFQETLAKLRKRILIDQWKMISPHELMFTDHWKFEELNSLEQIIHESVNFKHCLALAYTEKIASGEYVAFHMTNLEDQNIHLTLGCFFKFDQLHFDQLRLPNNEIAPKNIEMDAKDFIHKVNQYLIWDFKEQKVQ